MDLQIMVLIFKKQIYLWTQFFDLVFVKINFTFNQIFLCSV